MASKRIDISDGVWLEVLEERENKLFGRIEIDGLIHHELKPTPSRIEIRKKIAESYEKEVPVVYVKSIKTYYGRGLSRLHAHIYSSRELVERYEVRYIIDRNGGIELEG